MKIEGFLKSRKLKVSIEKKFLKDWAFWFDLFVFVLTSTLVPKNWGFVVVSSLFFWFSLKAFDELHPDTSLYENRILLNHQNNLWHQMTMRPSLETPPIWHNWCVEVYCPMEITVRPTKEQRIMFNLSLSYTCSICVAGLLSLSTSKIVLFWFNICRRKTDQCFDKIICLGLFGDIYVGGYCDGSLAFYGRLGRRHTSNSRWYDWRVFRFVLTVSLSLSLSLSLKLSASLVFSPSLPFSFFLFFLFFCMLLWPIQPMIITIKSNCIY